MVGAHDGVGQRLRGGRVLVDEALRRVQAGGRHRATENFVGLGHIACVGDDFQVTRTREQRDHRVEVADRVDLAGAHRRDRAAAGAHADDRHVTRLEPGFAEHEIREHVGARTRRGDTELLALQFGDALEVGHRLRVHAEHYLRRAALQRERAQALAFDLHADRVLERARDHIGAAADHRLQRARAAGEIGDGHVEPLGLEVAQALGDGERQVVQQVLAADRERELGLLDRLGKNDTGQRDQRCTGHHETATLHRPRLRSERRNLTCRAPARKRGNAGRSAVQAAAP